jgi:predicted RND superfamily exporter protein
MQPRRGRWLRLVAWLLFVGTCALLAWVQSRQRVDPQNRALKVPDGAAARHLAALAEIVPDDAVVLLAFAVPGELPLLPADVAVLEQLRQRTAAMPGVQSCRELPSPEPGISLFAASLRGGDPGSTAGAVVAMFRASAPPSVRVLATGLPLIEAEIAALVAAERQHVVPWILAALLLAALAIYRHPGVALAALLPAVAAIACTGGIVALTGKPLDPVAALLDPVLLTIGVAGSVHFVEAWRRARAQGLDADAAARFAAGEQRQPAFLATSTTMIGLLALCTSPVPAVIDFGLHAAFGIALAHVFTFALLPAWLPLAARKARPPHAAATALARWPDWVARHRGAWIAATAAVTSLALAALPGLRADNDPLTILPPEAIVRRDHDDLARRLGGVETFHLLVPARSPGSAPARLLPFLAAMQEQPALVSLAGPVLRGDTGDLAAPMLLRPAGSAAREHLFDDIERAATVLGLDGIVAAGPAVQIVRDSAQLMHGLLTSLWVTLALLGAGMCIGLRSLRLGLLGMASNVLPCIWIYGTIAWLDRPVSVATAMIACTMLGLIVDNTLHLLHHYRREREHPAAVTLAVQRCGRGVLLSSALLVAGFLVTTTSRLSTTVEFSLLACSSIVAALFSTAVLIPLALTRTGRRDAL